MRSGVRGEECLVGQAGGEPLDIEGLVETGVQLLAIGQKADLGSLARKQPSETWVKPTHYCPLGLGAARCTVPDMPDLVNHTVTLKIYVTSAKGTTACNAGHLRIV